MPPTTSFFCLEDRVLPISDGVLVLPIIDGGFALPISDEAFVLPIIDNALPCVGAAYTSNGFEWSAVSVREGGLDREWWSFSDHSEWDTLGDMRV